MVTREKYILHGWKMFSQFYRDDERVFKICYTDEIEINIFVLDFFFYLG